MHFNRRCPLLLLVFFGAYWIDLDVAQASLLNGPQSYIIPTSDGKHILVMLAPVPPADDVGNDCKLPSGERVMLRDTFPASGMYLIGSTTSIWKVDWYEREGHVKVSADGRFLVHINQFGVKQSAGRSIFRMSWGIRFYDAGIPFKSYEIGELVDYPSLIELTSRGWYYPWVDEFTEESQIHDGMFPLRTSTREEYTFEVGTGRIVSELRFWNTMVRISLAVAICIFSIVIAILIHRKRHPPAAVPGGTITIQKDEGGRSLRPWQFSLRRFMVVVAIAPLVFWLPHIAICCGSIMGSIASIRATLRNFRIQSTGPQLPQRGRRIGLACTVAVMLWSTYALSLPPTMLFGRDYLQLRFDTRMALLQTVYAPVYWFLAETPVGKWWLVECYGQAWEDTFRGKPPYGCIL